MFIIKNNERILKNVLIVYTPLLSCVMGQDYEGYSNVYKNYK